MYSCIIPVLNENDDQLRLVIENLVKGSNESTIQIIVVNDGSRFPDYKFKSILHEQIPWGNVKIINNTERHGVGYSFDRGSEIADGENLILMGGDVFAEEGWFNTMDNLIQGKQVGCFCSIGLQPGNYDITQEGLYERFGARIIYRMTIDDLPKNSLLRKNPNYKDILESKWMSKQSDEPYSIPCLLGAFYLIKKDFFRTIHGWDTVAGQFFRGAQAWGCLEPHLSLKIRVYGGSIIMFPNIRVGHIFGKITDADHANVRSIRSDLKYWNKLLVAHTLLDDELRDEVINYLPPSLNYGIAQVAIKKNWGYIQEIRARNKKEGKLISK